MLIGSFLFSAAVLVLGSASLSSAGQAEDQLYDQVQPSPLPTGIADVGFSLRFYANGVDDIDRVKIQVHEPIPGPPANVGATDFTIEFWIKGTVEENPAGPVQCGENPNWIYGNIILDRDRYNQDRKFGISLGAGRLVFGVSGDQTGDYTVCGLTNVLDNQWHHIAVQRSRSNGRIWIFVDGVLDAEAQGPGGDVSYPKDGVPGSFCGPMGGEPCVNDPFLVIGAEKHDADRRLYPSFSGAVDEVRLSNTLRYLEAFTPPSEPFTPDENTVALYHFDEGQGDFIADSSGAPGGPSDGILRFGGSPPGPEWVTDTPFAAIEPVEHRRQVR